MLVGLRAVGAFSYLMVGPPAPELGAVHRQLTDQGRELRVVRVLPGA